MTQHVPHPRSLGLDEEPDPDRSWVCGACGQEGDREDLDAGECVQPPLWDAA